jgi:uncharacterized protein (DUF934 family)
MRFVDSGAPLPPGTLQWPNTDDVQAHAQVLAAAPAIALDFPKWTDGRAYSQAVLLRQRLRYSGDIIATGQVLADMLPLLRRCGFNAVQMRADQSPEAAQRALGYFDAHYQKPPHAAEQATAEQTP